LREFDLNRISIQPGLEAHCSGALWLPEIQTALIADLHLGYSWAQRRRGELGPLADEHTKTKLLALVSELKPAEIIFLGDLVHAPRPCAPERAWIEELLADVSHRCRLRVARGNHDRAFARDFARLGMEVSEAWSNTLITAVHGDRLGSTAIREATVLVVGHLHPCLGVPDASGATSKLPVFLASERCIVLPAFSPFARGYDVSGGLPEELASCFQSGPIETYAAFKERVVRLGPLDRVLERMYSEPAGTPGQFRKARRTA
jgi:putative SbcD/Mre11-related phosphoesterase